MKDGATNNAQMPTPPKPITYTRQRLLELKNAPLSKAYPKDAKIIPGVTKPHVEPSAESSTEQTKTQKIRSSL